ncbi:MAG: MBG domain-containing protein [Bacteroidota bacterium]
MEQEFVGKLVFVEVSTVPENLEVAVLYDVENTAPTEVGDYLLEANIVDNNYEGNASATLKVMEVIGLDDNDVTRKLVVYQNPTFGQLLIEDNSDRADDASLLLFDTQGRFLRSYFKSKLAEQITIDLSDQVPGKYFIYYMKQEKIGVLKIVK